MQSLRRALLQKLLGFVDLRRKIRAPASVRVVEQHQRAMRLADLVFCDASLAIQTQARVSCRFGVQAYICGERQRERNGTEEEGRGKGRKRELT